MNRRSATPTPPGGRFLVGSPRIPRPPGMPTAAGNPGSGAARLALLAVALLPMAALGGCRTVNSPRGLAEGQADPPKDDLAGPMRSALSPPAGSPTLPTDPEPMPELTPHRTTKVHLDLGRVFEAKGQLDAAEGEYRRALEAADRKVGRDTRALAHRRLASVLDRQGKFADSATHHREATRLAAKDARTWNDAGYSAYLQGDFDEAIALLRKAEKLAPEDARVATNLGLALAASGKKDEAIGVLSRAGGPAAAQANLAYVLAATGNPEAARTHYEEALRMNPQHALARQAIGRLDSPMTSPEVIASRPYPVDPAVAPASFEAVDPPEIPQPIGPAVLHPPVDFGGPGMR